jgi:thiamine-monophosphate kinase
LFFSNHFCIFSHEGDIQEMKHPHTEISSVGEFALIDRIREIVQVRVDDAHVHENLLLGIDDDAAVYRPTEGMVQLLTTDALVEGIHFDLTYTSMKHLGWKAMTASLSDIAAMGGMPRYATIALSLPQKISVEMVEEFYAGVTFVCKKYSCLIVGGDTTSTKGNMMVSVTLTGEAREPNILYRKGAVAGDYLCVSGHLGGSLAGLKILQREKDRFFKSPDAGSFQSNLEPYAPAIEKHLMPKPRLDLSKILAHDVKTHAMIDISDGLASEVHLLCTAGEVGAEVYEHNLPVEMTTQNIAAEFSESPTTYALFGGEEYELLFTISDKEFAKLEMLTNDVTIIGRITANERVVELVKENGEREALRPGGWNHFK